MAAAAELEPLTHPAIAWAHPVVQEWFLNKFGSPTEPQIAGWPAILRNEPTLISAPTGSGKTLAAFLVCIDKLLRQAIAGELAPHTHVVYISPLKALSNDVQKNLDGPLAEIQQLALKRGFLCPEIRTGVRTGDTLQKHRTAMLKHPPHILVTTPESLYILLTAGKPRQNLTRVSTVIVDEIHAIADDKRGAHLALTLERLDALVCGENRLRPGAFLTGLSHAPQRIGLSATQNPIELVANFLVGAKIGCPGSGFSDPGPQDAGWPIHDDGTIVDMSGEHHLPTNHHHPATIIQVGQRRLLDLAIEVPSDELGSITSIAMWTEIFDKLATLANEHRSTLVFVNTRRLVEKISFELTERLGEEAVAAHHGSLSRLMRLDAEQRLKNGECKILIATASLELGIDIGTVDLVCQIATTRAVAVAMQRVGRAGHWRGAIPKGRFFATTRDDLLEQAALLRKMHAGELDRLEIPDTPIDVLMQQIVAMCGAESWVEQDLYNVVRRAWPYRNLTHAAFEEVLDLLHNGIESSRGRYGAYLLRDKVQGHLHARRGARSIAISNGGAIPDTSLFAVMLQPENVQIATLDEHFAVDSSPGDVVLLGNTSWRIQRIDPQGKVLVEDAHGAPPTIPFWEGEAPQRTSVVSDGVSALRAEIDQRTRNIKPSDLLRADTTNADTTNNDALILSAAKDLGSSLGAAKMSGSPGPGPERSRMDRTRVSTEASTNPTAQLADTTAFLKQTCFLSDSAALQLITYIVNGRAILGAVPTTQTIIAERFFDEGGGQQLILHAPFGGRINKAFGLALRKRFCRGFNFELQAAATDNGINISLAEQHSFPLQDVFRFLTEHTARELLEQASIPSPLFKNRWRWAAGRSLQLLRMSKGKRIAPQIQRTRSDDLLASVFPHASACPETMTGDIEIPDHPLVREVMKDTLTEAMDIEGLLDILRKIDSGAITCLAVDTPVPSQFAHELIHAMPYAFLDDEDAAARRTRAVTLRKGLPDSVTAGAGLLDQAAINTVRQQLTPDIRDEHELHDLLLQLIALPATNPGAPCPSHLGTWVSSSAQGSRNTQHWPHFLNSLEQQNRAHLITINNMPTWFATERLAEAALLWPESSELKNIVILAGAQRSGETRSLPGTEERPAIDISPRDAAITTLVQGWLQILGPTTANKLAALTHLHPSSLHQAFLAMEMQGLAMRGAFEHPATESDLDIEWCERRILHRIHRLTLGTLRKQVEPVNAAVFMRWLLDWHHLALGTKLTGEEGVLAAIEQLEGFEAPAVEWERSILPARVANYDPRWLDNLCLAGIVAWGRISPHPAWTTTTPGAPSSEAVLSPPKVGQPRRVIPTIAAPITFYLRESAEWLPHALAAKSIDEKVLTQSLSPEAQQIRAILAEKGAAFTADLQRLSDLTKLQTTTALWELATAGLAAADGFDQLRAMMDPRRKSAAIAQTPATSLRKRAAARTTAGRWSLLCCEPQQNNPPQMRHPERSPKGEVEGPATPSAPSTLRAPSATEATARAIAAARATTTALDAHARILLCRYGVLFRELLARESNAPKWRDLLPILRRLEARGEIRGGRFVTGAFGEQFALPEVIDQLRAARKASADRASEAPITVPAADPLNLAGILVPGDRIPAIPGRELQFHNGSVVQPESTEPAIIIAKPKRTRSMADILRADAIPTRPTQPAPPAGLFQ